MLKSQKRYVDPVNSTVALWSLVCFLQPQPSEVILKEQQHSDETELMRQHLKLASKSIFGKLITEPGDS